MGKNMNYIGPRVNSPSWDREHKGKDPESAANYFMRTPTGILLRGLARKAGVNVGSITYDDIDDYNLTNLEKHKMKQAFSKYNIYMAQLAVQYAKNRRSYLKESQFPDNYTNSERGYKYSTMLEDEDEDNTRCGRCQFGMPPLDVLELKRKKKIKKAKSKRKPVKKCRCKK